MCSLCASYCALFIYMYLSSITHHSHSAPRIMAKLRKVHAHYSSDHALVGSSTGTSHNMTTAPILSDYSASTANFDDDDDVEGINYETAETSNTLLLSSLSSASLTGVAPPAVTDTNTVPLCAVVIDLSKACQWDVAGLHVVEVGSSTHVISLCSMLYECMCLFTRI